MKLERKLFSKKKKELTEEEKKYYEDLGIASGLTMAGSGAIDYLLARNVEKKFPGGFITSKGKLEGKISPEVIKKVKNAGKFFIPAGLVLAGTSAGIKLNRKRKHKKDDETKA